MNFEVKKLSEIARELRLDVLERTYKTNSAHLGSCFSTVEIITALYFAHLKVDPNKKTDPERDRFVLSKGHACLSLYCALNRRGFISQEVMAGYGIDGGTLEHHSKFNLEYGIELSTGSLGHGLPVSSGMAYMGKKGPNKFRVFTLLSDGELNEGSNWEAILFAAHHKLNNLVAIVDYNKIQALGNVKDVIGLDPLAEKWQAFGWNAYEVDGHNPSEIVEHLKKAESVLDRPTVLIAHTIKGKGVSFMENKLLWHYRCPNEKELADAKAELRAHV
ncbi:MAG: transketolase [Pseudomonadota bacterium]|nr:transketolase [Pseudomonadota bacterium]